MRRRRCGTVRWRRPRPASPNGEAAATKIHDQGYCRTVPTTKVAHALRYLYDHRPAMSLRAIGVTPEVDLHHDNVGKIRAGATAVFGTAPGAGRT